MRLVHTKSKPNLFNLLYKARRLMRKREAAFILLPLTEASVSLMYSLSNYSRLIPR